MEVDLKFADDPEVVFVDRRAKVLLNCNGTPREVRAAVFRKRISRPSASGAEEQTTTNVNRRFAGSELKPSAAIGP